MNKDKIIQLCQNIIRFANDIDVRGEKNLANVLNVCQFARQIAAEVKTEEVESDGR